MYRPSQVALIRFGKATASIVVLGLCMSFLPLGLVVLMPFVVLSCAHLVVQGGLSRGLASAIVAGVLIGVVAGGGMAAAVFLVALGVGGVLGEAVRRQWPFGRALAATASAALVALVLWGVTLWQVLGLDPTALREAAFDSIEHATELYVQAGVSAGTTETVSGQLQQLVGMLPYLAPGLLGMGVILLAACCIGLAYWLFPRLRDTVEVRMGLSRFRMHWSMAYLSIAGLALLLVYGGGGGWRTAMLYSGLNLLLVSQTLFFLQGLGIVHWFVKIRQMQSGARAALYVIALFGQVFLQLTGLLGLFDTWLDCRKRFALEGPRSGSLR